MGRSKLGGRYQTLHELDGLDLPAFEKPAGIRGDETRAVKRDLTTKAIKWWARGQLRYMKGDWEVYRPMIAEIEQLRLQRMPVAEIQKAVLKRISARCATLGTSPLIRDDSTISL